MNLNKEIGLGDIYGHFGHSVGGKSDGWHGDIDEILAKFTEGFADSRTCEKPPEKVRYPEHK